MIRTALIGLMLVAGATAGCGSADGAGEAIRVVATTTVLGDVAQVVVGDAGRVETLIPIGVDPHDFQASARQVTLLVEADLVVANGLGLEEGLEDVLDAAARDGARVLSVGELLDPLPYEAGDTDHGSDDDEHDEDPHIWLDPIRMAEAARLIGRELGEIVPGEPWSERADAYATELAETDAAIREIVATVPEDRRKLVTNHASFGYFAARYGFEVIGVVIPGGSTLGDPSSAELATLVEKLRDAGVPALFAETTESSELAEAVAAELGGDVAVVELYAGSLGPPGSGADTLVGMLLENAARIAEALR